MTTNVAKPATAWLLLISRSALFLVFQTVIALVYLAGGGNSPFVASARWWPLIAALTNLVSIYLLVLAFQVEGMRYRDILRFSRQTLKTDLIWFFGSGFIGLPIAAVPMNILAAALFGDSMIPVHMMFQPLPDWAMAASILFPLTIAFSELPTYFGYVMPRLARALRSGWAAWMVSSLFLAVQHSFLPFILDGRFMLWRAGMYLPFALFAGLLLKLRPGLLPYFAIVHCLIDFATLSTYFML